MIDGTDKHCALAFLESDHMKYIKCVQNDAVVRGYLYNKETALWKLFMSTNDIFYIVSDFLEAYYGPLIDKQKFIISKIDVEDKHKQREGLEILKLLKNTKKSMCAKRKINEISTLILTKIVDDKFYNVIDAHTTLLPIKNNRIIDLKTLEIRLRTWNDYFTYELDVDLIDDKVNDHTNTPNAFKYFTQVMSEYGKSETPKTDYFINVLGYSITKETNLKEFYLWYGPCANNGKSTCFSLVTTIFQKLTTTLTSSIITNKEEDKIEKANFSIFGKRIGAINELSEHLELGESNTKTLTGGCDAVIAKELYKNTFPFIPIIKIHILSNFQLIINVDQPAMVNRFTIISFNSVFSEKPKGENEYLIEEDFINDLKTKYKDEIFTMIVKGAHNFYLNKKKITKPEIVIAEKKKYIEQISYVQNFINEQCMISDDYRIKGKTLFEAFVEYCKETGDKFKGITMENFYNRLRSRNYKFTVINGYKYVVGITLCSDMIDVTQEDKMTKTDKDIVKCYCITYCEYDDKYKVKTSALFNHFYEQTKETGFSNISFKTAMIENGFVVYKTGGYDHYKGIRIKELSNFNNSIFKVDEVKPVETIKDVEPVEEVKEKEKKVKEIKKEKVKEIKKEKIKEVKKEDKKEKVKEDKKEKVKEDKKEKVKEDKIKAVKKDKKKDIEKSEEVITLDFDECESKAMSPKYTTEDDATEDDATEDDATEDETENEEDEDTEEDEIKPVKKSKKLDWYNSRKYKPITIGPNKEKGPCLSKDSDNEIDTDSDTIPEIEDGADYNKYKIDVGALMKVMTD